MFDTLDVDGCGHLCVASIKSVVGMDFDDTEVEAMIAEADLDGDGRVKYDEFARVWRNHLSGPRAGDSGASLQQVHGAFTVVTTAAHLQAKTKTRSRSRSPSPEPTTSSTASVVAPSLDMLVDSESVGCESSSLAPPLVSPLEGGMNDMMIDSGASAPGVMAGAFAQDECVVSDATPEANPATDDDSSDTHSSDSNSGDSDHRVISAKKVARISPPHEPVESGTPDYSADSELSDRDGLHDAMDMSGR